MNWKTWTPLAVALVLGLLAARMAMNLQPSEATASVSAPTNLTTIMIAAHDMEPGMMFSDLDIAEGRVDPASVPTGAFHNKAELINRVAKIQLVKGQAVIPTLLADDGAGAGIGATLAPGMRTFTIAIDATSGAAGMIQPTCRVDVLTTINSDGTPKAKTLMENVFVLTVGQRQNPNTPAAEPASTVTLLVTPTEAEKLELATSTGRVRLLLRNGKDNAIRNAAGLTVAAMKGDEGSTTQPSNTGVAAFTAPKGLDIPRGMRAYAMEISDVSGVAGFIQPDANVDVITTEVTTDGRKKAKTLLANVKVLAVGSRLVAGANPAESARTVTLLLKPSDVEKMEQALAAAPLRLALRNKLDVDTDSKDDAPAPANKEWTVEAIKAGASSKFTFELPGR